MRNGGELGTKLNVESLDPSAFDLKDVADLLIEHELSVKIMDDLMDFHENRTIPSRADFQGMNSWTDRQPLLRPVCPYSFPAMNMRVLHAVCPNHILREN